MTVSRWTVPIRPVIAWLTIAIAALLVADGWAFLTTGAHGYYLFAPGTAPTITTSTACKGSSPGGDLLLPDGKPCARLDVPASKSHPIGGRLYMVDVLVGPATPLDYLLGKIGLLDTFNQGSQLLPSSEVLGSTPRSQLGCQDTQQMQGSTSSAAVVAVRRLGYVVKQNDLGAQLYQVEPGTPAAAAGLRCSDVVTSIAGAAVHTSDDLVAALRAHKPGDSVVVTANRQNSSGATRAVTVQARLAGTPAIGGRPADPTHAFLGVVAQTDSTYTFPFDVKIDVGDIGGPSAGLALTLGIIDTLSDGRLTGGLRVAATGTISLDGTVGDVGGVAQKTVAVRKAGAQVFLVPPQEIGPARREAGSMKVFAVSSLAQALSDLEALGGHIPPPPSGQNGSG